MTHLPVYHQLPEFTQTHVPQVGELVHPTISSSVIPFFSCLQSFPVSGSFPMSQLFAIRWPKYWSFSLTISPSNEHPGLVSFRMDWLDLLAVQGTLKSLLQHHSSKASVLQHSALFTGECWIPPKKDTLCPWAKEKPQQECRRGKIMFRIKPHTYSSIFAWRIP